MMLNLQRHNFVGIVGNYSPDEIVTAQNGDRERILRWLSEVNLCVIRRPVLEDAGTRVSLAVSFPLSENKYHSAFSVPAHIIAQVSAPPLLNDCISILPQFQQNLLAPLLADTSLSPRVFGSLAWQFLSKQQYLTDNSDIDLVYRIEASEDWSRLKSFLNSALPDSKRLKTDIEMTLPGDNSFSWHEFRSQSKKLLIKGAKDCSIIPKEEIVRFFK